MTTSKTETAKKPRTRKPPAAKLVRGGGAKLKAVASPPPPSEFDFIKALDEMPETFVTCRDFMHAWTPYTARYQPTERTFRSTVKCSRCGTFKIRILSKTGAILESWYDYPEGYLMQGAGRLNTSDRDRIRLRSIQGVLSLQEVSEAQHA